MNSRTTIKAVVFVIPILIVLIGCGSYKQTSHPIKDSLPPLPQSAPLPDWLLEIRPAPSSVITQNEYISVIEPDSLYIGPPPPSVDEVGLRSSICLYIDVEPLVEPGDLLFGEERVLKRIQLIVDDAELNERAETEYLAVIEPGPDCRCFYDCKTGWDEYLLSNFSTPPPENIGCWFYPGYWNCYHTDLDPGQHKATINFSKFSGDIASYSWFFEIVE